MTPTSTAAIIPGNMYPLSALAQLGFGKAAVREMRKRGVPVRRYGRTSFVLADDLIENIMQNGRIVP